MTGTYDAADRRVVVMASRQSTDDGDYHEEWIKAIHPDDLHRLRSEAAENFGEMIYEEPCTFRLAAAIRAGVPSPNVHLDAKGFLQVDDDDDDDAELEREMGIDIEHDDCL
jgi:hypothetical protein